MSLESKTFNKVPEWNTYYPDLSEATPEQNEFYNYWLKNFEKDKFMDVEGNLSYIFVYLYSVIKRFIKDKDIDRLLRSFEKVSRGYGGKEEKIRGYLIPWTSDAYLYLNDCDKAWEVRKGRNLQVTDVINLRAKCRDTSIDVEDLIRLPGGNGLTNFGKKH